MSVTIIREETLRYSRQSGPLPTLTSSLYMPILLALAMLTSSL